SWSRHSWPRHPRPRELRLLILRVDLAALLALLFELGGCGLHFLVVEPLDRLRFEYGDAGLAVALVDDVVALHRRADEVELDFADAEHLRDLPLGVRPADDVEGDHVGD